MKRQDGPFVVVYLFARALNPSDNDEPNSRSQLLSRASFLHPKTRKVGDPKSVFDSTGWETTVFSTVRNFSQNEITILSDGANNMVVLLSPCSYLEAGKITRLVRNQLYREYTNHELNIAARYLDQAPDDTSSLVSDLLLNLLENMKNRSSKIDVRKAS